MSLRELMKPRFLAIGSYYNGTYYTPDTLLYNWKVPGYAVRCLDLAHADRDSLTPENMQGLIPLWPQEHYWDAMLNAPAYPLTKKQAQQLHDLLNSWNLHWLGNLLGEVGVQKVRY